MRMGRWWALGVTLALVVAGLVAALAWGPPDVQAQIWSGLLALGAAIGGALVALLTRDADEDGTPDVVQWVLRRLTGDDE